MFDTLAKFFSVNKRHNIIVFESKFDCFTIFRKFYGYKNQLTFLVGKKSQVNALVKFK
jgi:hypothetical protein